MTETFSDLEENSDPENSNDSNVDLDEIEVGSYLLVKCLQKDRSVVHYAGEVMKIKKRCFLCKFMRRNPRVDGQFYYPDVDEIVDVPVDDVKKILHRQKSGTTARQNRYISFLENLRYDVLLIK